jgi:hypothetical protein
MQPSPRRTLAVVAPAWGTPHGVVPGVVVDAHVHCHPCFDRAAFLAAAAANLARGAAEIGLPGAARCLLLAERSGERWFDALVCGEEAGGWRVLPTEEPEALLLCRAGSGRSDSSGRSAGSDSSGRSDGSDRSAGSDGSNRRAGSDNRDLLVVVAGRQVAAREGIEVLALGTLAGEGELRDGLPLAEALARAAARGALAVLLWGFGKWWGGRGRRVRDALDGFEGVAPLYLGDSAARPRGAPSPRLFREASRRGLAILPGTDPLAFASEVGRAGSYGAVLAGSFDLARPLASLRALLARPGGLATFGRRAGWGEAALAQARLRIERRRARRTETAQERAWTA